jgi:hypothetical protein
VEEICILGVECCDELHILGMDFSDEWFLAEINLCRFALQTSNTACLEALLDAGCRSEWMCPMAALEGREAHLALAAGRGCCCDGRTLYVAAGTGNLSMLRAAHRHATVDPCMSFDVTLCSRQRPKEAT